MVETREALDAFERLRIAGWVLDDPEYGAILNEHTRQHFQAIRQAYPNADPLNAQANLLADRRFFRDYLTQATRMNLEAGRQKMRLARRQIWNRYIHERQSRDGQNVDVRREVDAERSGFARALSYYLAVCSSAPYANLQEDRQRLRQSRLGLPETARRIPERQVPTGDQLGGGQAITATEPAHLDVQLAWGRWNGGHARPGLAHALYLAGVENRNALKNQLFVPGRAGSSDNLAHPVVVFAPKFWTPRHTYEVLRRPARDRNRELKRLIRQIANFLAAGEDEFFSAMMRDDWVTLRPALHSTRQQLFPTQNTGNIQAEPKLNSLAHAIIDEDLQDIARRRQRGSTANAISAICMVASIALGLASLGVATAAAASAVRTVSLILGAIDFATPLIAAHQDNQSRARINRFAAINQSLLFAARPHNLTAMAASGLASILLMEGIFRGAAVGIRFYHTNVLRSRPLARPSQTTASSPGQPARRDTGIDTPATTAGAGLEEATISPTELEQRVAGSRALPDSTTPSDTGSLLPEVNEAMPQTLQSPADAAAVQSSVVPDGSGIQSVEPGRIDTVGTAAPVSDAIPSGATADQPPANGNPPPLDRAADRPPSGIPSPDARWIDDVRITDRPPRRPPAGRSGGMDRYSPSTMEALERYASTRSITMARLRRTLSSVHDDVAEFVEYFHNAPGFESVLSDYLRGGNFRIGARFVMRFAAARVPRSSNLPIDIVFEQVRNRGLRRTDMVFQDIRYEFKSYIDIRNLGHLRRQLRRDIADVLAQRPDLSGLRWVFDNNRMAQGLSRAELVSEAQRVLGQSFRNHPRAGELSSYLEHVIELW